jgi:DNA-nicking Smr family endonuclease
MGKKRKEKNFDYERSFDQFIPDSELDFHEFGILTEYEIEVILNNYIEDSYLLNLKNLLIITGKGKVVRPLVNKLLKINKYVESFNKAGYFNGQDGAIEVVLK